MSGMEPLAALGLACNIIQLLSFGGEAISLCRKVYKTGEIDPSLKDYSSQTAKICENLNDTLTQRQLDLGPDALALQQSATMCKAAADKLNRELELLTPTSGASGWRRGFTAPIKAIRYKHYLSELEKDLNNLKSGLDTQLLGLLATTLQQVASGQQDLSQQMVKALEGAQDRFNSEYFKNQRMIEEQIAATARDLQHGRTRVQQEKRESEQRQDWEHLLKSLHFDARTERVNMIKQEYSDTCRWIFKPSTEYGLASDHNPQQAYPENQSRSWPCFTTWLQSEGPPIYWICGKPGSGKSTLMKFIASDESPIRDSLEQWQPDVQMLSHYFWLAGSPMQNSIKGFLCSLVYQVLSQDVSVALNLLESNPDIARKSSAVDWDPTELRRILIDLAHQPAKSFCIFIDGLDELSPDESPRDLIAIITELQSPQIKLCLSSRPEPAMKKYLGHYPTLPMHIFIQGDIKKYAEGVLNEAMSHRNDTFKIDRLVHEVLFEADGVFLWAVLVTRSLERGIEKGDSHQLLVERLRQMPKSISELYSSMWQRCEDDPETYQKGFSQFMNLMILARKGMMCLEHNNTLTVFELMAATNTWFLDKYLNQDDQVSTEKLELLCRNTRNSIEAWSAGLLMVTIIPFETDGDSGPYCDLEFYINMKVGYVHRTARDFLLDEAEGQKLWKRVEVSREDLEAKLVKACLMKCQLWGFKEPEREHFERFLMSIHFSGDSRDAAYVPQNTLPVIEKAFYKRYWGKPLWTRILNKHGGLEIEFLEAAADHGFRDYVFRRIQEMQQTGQLKAQDFASLLYAYCSRRLSLDSGIAAVMARERLIQSLLSLGLPSFAKLRFSTGFNLSRSLLLTYLVSILEVSIPELYPSDCVVEEAVTTLTLLWEQAPSIHNVYVRLVVRFSRLPDDDHTQVQWYIQNTMSRSFYRDGALVVMRVNVSYLVMAIGSLAHPSLCISGTLSKKEEPSAQAILINIGEEIWQGGDYYPIKKRLSMIKSELLE
ncbi:hypothetical protein LCI18_003412 [Fusarium solani-melongenae]|uniref:Uncharacterized protein n=1 Tax=Fusarium solani subsp. cucurbitae TaxID=2747967 RepID=A0ACD3YU18_FUSSC|nr:hypothetical protein LCI18_003412 [Fusarium solani-melongenae]